MKIRKRMFSVMLSLAVIFSVSYIPAAAAGSDTQTENWVARVDGVYYDTLAEAFAAVKTEGTVELVADAAVDELITIPQGTSVTLNLGAYTIEPSETFNNVVIFNNKGTLTIEGEAEGAIDVTGRKAVLSAVENRGGQLNITSGRIISNMWGVRALSGTTRISGGEISVATNSTQTCAVYVNVGATTEISGTARISSANVVAEVYGGIMKVSGEAYLSGKFGINLYNSIGENLSNAEPASLTMTGGTVEATYGFALAGNNTMSAKCSAEITGGVLRSVEDGTGIYWPMEGELTIGGNAVVEGGTGIEAKMGTITIKDSARITGTGAWREDRPYDGGSQAEGSAILASAQMYGAGKGQYIESPALTVNIIGGILSGMQGNAVTVYNTEDIKEQTANVSVTGGELNAAEGRTDVKVIMASGSNQAKLKQENGINSFVTSQSETTVTVSADAVLAAVDQNGETAFYTDVDEALKANTGSADDVHIYVLGDSEISGEALESQKVKLTAAYGVRLKVTSKVEDMIVLETTNADGSKTYELVSEGQFVAPQVTLSADRTQAHIDETITLTAKAVHEETDVTYSYEWYKDGEQIENQTDAVLKITESGTYTVKVTAYKAQNGSVLHSAEVESAPVTCTLDHTYGDNWKFDESNHWHECFCGAKDGLQEHTFGAWKVTKEPTATEPGSRERTCSVCGYTEKETVPSTGQTGTTEPPTTGTPTGETPKTSDDSNMGVYIFLLLLSGSALAGNVMLGLKKARR